MNQLKNLLLLAIIVIGATTATLFIGCTGDPIPVDEPCDTCDTGSGEPSGGSVVYSGIRSSYYGFDNFPTPEEAVKVMTNIANKIGGTPSSVWIVGGIHDTNCGLEFPNPTNKEYENITFRDYDKHESYLTAFDNAGIKVFLQVEAGMANIFDLIDLVMAQYGHHKSVVGFGVDVEWYPSNGITNGVSGGINQKLTDTHLKEIDDYIKKKNKDHRVFVKHWVADYCGSKPVSDVIYINDSQGFGGNQLNNMTSEFKKWADYFAPCDVGFQIGYPNDQSWWSAMSDPIQEINDAIKDRITSQKVHIYWVDFTIQNSMFNDLWR